MTAFRTPASGEELARALRRGHVSVFGREPGRARLSVAWSQVMHETGGMASCWNHNVGNIGCGKAWTANGNDCMVIPGAGGPAAGNPVEFRSYRDLDDGARDYWDLLRSVRYEDAVGVFDTGDPRLAARALHDAGYFTDNDETTDDAATYGGGMARYLRDFDPRWVAVASGSTNARGDMLVDVLMVGTIFAVAHQRLGRRGLSGGRGAR